MHRLSKYCNTDRHELCPGIAKSWIGRLSVCACGRCEHVDPREPPVSIRTTLSGEAIGHVTVPVTESTKDSLEDIVRLRPDIAFQDHVAAMTMFYINYLMAQMENGRLRIVYPDGHFSELSIVPSLPDEHTGS